MLVQRTYEEWRQVLGVALGDQKSLAVAIRDLEDSESTLDPEDFALLIGFIEQARFDSIRGRDEPRPEGPA